MNSLGELLSLNEIDKPKNTIPLDGVETKTKIDKDVAPKKDKKNEVSFDQVKPGRLVKSGKIILQTRSAQRIYLGQRHGSVGLERFDHVILRIWEAASRDDPYADLFLLNIYKELMSSRKTLQQDETKYQPLLSSVEGVELSVWLSNQPLKIPLRPLTPYGFIAAFLLADFDRLARLLVSAKYMGLMIRKQADELLAEKERLVKTVFSTPLKWKNTGVTRKDIQENNATAQRAIAANMGKLPERVLKCLLRAPYAPHIKEVS